MHIGIFGTGLTDSSEKYLKKILDEHNISSSKIGIKNKNKKTDCVFVLGGDKGVRNYFHRTFDSSIPVLGINESESDGFLSQLDLKQLPLLISRIKKMDFETEPVTRLGVKIDGKNVYPVLNDVAVFSSRSAMLMEHTLRVNGDEVWHDSSDGVIISTPIGSSAYSMSAGGPVIFQDSDVFGIISVNSLDITRRPLIVSNSSVIEIDEISSRLHCEVVLDGLDRYKVKNSVEATNYEPSAKIIRLKKDTTAISAIAKKVKLAEELFSMPPSSKLLLKILEYEGSMSQKELVKKTMLPDRTVRLAMSHLLEKELVKKKVSIRDSRQKIYEISKLINSDLQQS
jgi:NAD+ kinase